MSKEVKKCKKCGRPITNPKNKSGFCSECTGQGTVLLAVAALVGISITKTIKFVGKKAPIVLKTGKEMINLVKNKF